MNLSNAILFTCCTVTAVFLTFEFPGAEALPPQDRGLVSAAPRVKRQANYIQMQMDRKRNGRRKTSLTRQFFEEAGLFRVGT